MHLVDQFTVSAKVNASPKEVYDAWLDTKKHGEMTGSTAFVTPGVGGKFSAWDGYIEGTTLELKPNNRIVQAWRSSDFPAGAPDSRVEITFEQADAGTKVTITHTNIPDGQGPEFKDGWDEFYFQPMKAYFKKAKPAAAKGKKEK
jgi:activator of HSP90 ATPase